MLPLPTLVTSSGVPLLITKASGKAPWVRRDADREADLRPRRRGDREERLVRRRRVRTLNEGRVEPVAVVDRQGGHGDFVRTLDQPFERAVGDVRHAVAAERARGGRGQWRGRRRRGSVRIAARVVLVVDERDAVDLQADRVERHQAVGFADHVQVALDQGVLDDRGLRGEVEDVDVVEHGRHASGACWAGASMSNVLGPPAPRATMMLPVTPSTAIGPSVGRLAPFNVKRSPLLLVIEYSSGVPPGVEVTTMFVDRVVARDHHAVRHAAKCLDGHIDDAGEHLPRFRAIQSAASSSCDSR